MRYLLLFALLAAVAVYLYFFLLRALVFWLPRAGKAVLRAAAAVVAIGLAALCANLFSTVTLAVLHVVAFALAVDLIRLAADGIMKIFKRKPDLIRRIWRCGLVPLAVTALFFCYGALNIRDVRQTAYTVYTDKSLRPDGYRVALITDLHFGTALSLSDLEAYCADIEAAEPDLVVLGGDIVDESTTKAEMQSVFAVLGDIESEFGSFFVFGNHDRAPYTASPNFTEAELLDALASGGITPLEDDAVLLNGELLLAGRADYGSGGAAPRATTEALLSGYDRNRFILLLDHQPVGFAENIAAGVDLQLSGHTHNGQIWPVAHVIEWLGTADLVYGYRQIGAFQAIVSSGIVGWGYPIRTQGHSEYVVIDIRPAA